MSKKGFDLAALAKASMGEAVSKMDIDTEVVKIPAAQIDTNGLNFYEQSGLDALAASIELTGLMHPPIVKEQGGRYTLIDGERRFRAMTEKLGWSTVPCIIRKPASSILEELMLIEANRQQRTMSAADLSKQAERYTELLADLKRSGVEIPGRLRTAVAEAFQVSESKLARLSAIRKNLIPALLERFDLGQINEAVAYNLSQREEDFQILWVGVERILDWRVTQIWQNWETVKKLDREDCGGCSNRAAMLARIEHAVDAGQHWTACNGCCLDCYRDCGHRCAKSVARNKEKEEARRKEREDLDARQAEREADRKAAADAWEAKKNRVREDSGRFIERVRERMEARGVSAEDLAEATSWDADELGMILDGEDEFDLFMAEYTELFDFAEALGCTVGELLGEKVSESDTTESGWHRTETDGRPEMADVMAKILLTMDKYGKAHLLTAANFEETFDLMPDWCIAWRLVDLPEG